MGQYCSAKRLRSLSLFFSLPHIFFSDGRHFCWIHEQEVASVKVPGESGEYGITAGHTPLISPMKPGVFQIFHDAVSTHELGLCEFVRS